MKKILLLIFILTILTPTIEKGQVYIIARSHAQCWNPQGTGVGNFFRGIASRIGSAAESVASAVGSAAQAIGNATSNMANAVGNAFDSAANAIGNAFSSWGEEDQESGSGEEWPEWPESSEGPEWPENTPSESDFGSFNSEYQGELDQAAQSLGLDSFDFDAMRGYVTGSTDPVWAYEQTTSEVQEYMQEQEAYEALRPLLIAADNAAIQEETAALNFQDNLLIQPCYGTGRYGWAYFQGTVEHVLIQNAYLAINNNARREFSIPGGAASGYRGFADIADPVTGEIYEIKPDNDNGKESGRNEVNHYVSQAQVNCQRPAGSPVWRKGTSFTPLWLPNPRNPTKAIYVRLSEDGVIVYDNNKDRNSAPEYIKSPFQERETLRDLIRRLAQVGFNTTTAAGLAGLTKEITDFLRRPENKKLALAIKTSLQTVAVGIIIGSIVEDIVTLGAGVADDAATYVVARQIWFVANKIILY